MINIADRDRKKNT